MEISISPREFCLMVTKALCLSISASSGAGGMGTGSESGLTTMAAAPPAMAGALLPVMVRPSIWRAVESCPGSLPAAGGVACAAAVVGVVSSAAVVSVASAAARIPVPVKVC